MLIDRKKLLNACKLLQCGTSVATDIVAGGDCILFDNDYLRTYNERMSLSHALNTNISCGVKSNEFINLLSKMKDNEVSVELDNTSLKVSDSVTSSQWNTLQYGAIVGHITNLGLKELKWKPLSERFISALSASYYSANKSDLLNNLCGVYCGERDVIACNNISVSWCLLEKYFDADEKFILSVESVQSLLRMETEFKSYCYNDPWLHLSNDNDLIVSIHVLSGEYPVKDIKKLFDDTKGKKYSFPEDFQETLDRIGVLSFQEESRIGIENIVEIYSPRKGRLICRGERSLGKASEAIKIPYNAFPTDTRLYCNVQHLKNMLQRSNDFIVNGRGAILFMWADQMHMLFAMKGEDNGETTE